jgi:hypothetical protein
VLVIPTLPFTAVTLDLFYFVVNGVTFDLGAKPTTRASVARCTSTTTTRHRQRPVRFLLRAAQTCTSPTRHNRCLLRRGEWFVPRPLTVWSAEDVARSR